MSLFKFEVENFKRIRSLAFELKGRITELSGVNGAGKSSAIDAVWVLLKGLQVAPAVPIHKGAERARIKGQLGELVVERTFRRKGDAEYTSTLKVSNPDGAAYPSPQKKLDEIIGQHRLDPLDFIDMDAKKQFEVLRQFVPGFDFEAVDAENKADYELRTDINRRAQQAQAAADAITVAFDPPGERLDEAELVAKIQRADQHNIDVGQRKTNRTALINSIKSFTDEAASLRERATALRAEADKLDKKAEFCDSEAADKQKRLDSADPLPELIDVSALALKINEAREANRVIDEWAVDNRRRDELYKAAAALAEESDTLTARMAERTEQKQSAIAKAHMPVDGISFADGSVLLNDVPFAQASRAQQLRTSTAISLAMNPKLPLIWIRDGSLLDDDSIAIIHEQAEKYDGYVIIETVRAIGSDAIVLEEGHRKDALVKEDAT